MSVNGLEVFDKTVHTTNSWLAEIMDRLNVDRQQAWRVLGSVLRTLRDRLPVDLAAHLGSQLPLLVRGGFYDQFVPARLPTDCHTPEEFVAAIAADLEHIADAEDALRVVISVLERHVSEGQIVKVRHALPRGIRLLWDSADTRQVVEAGAEA